MLNLTAVFASSGHARRFVVALLVLALIHALGTGRVGGYVMEELHKSLVAIAMLAGARALEQLLAER